MPKGKTESIKWTGKNLAEIKRVYKNAAHYPREAGDESYRDASQHPDNLHLTNEDGTTLVAAVGDTITKDAEGRVTVQQTAAKRPVATGRFGGGRLHEVQVHSSPRSKPREEPET